MDPQLCGVVRYAGSRSFSLTGSTVTSITNKASGVAWTEGTNPPGYSAAGFNGLPCMTFAPLSLQKIMSTEAAVVAAMANNTAGTVFTVAKTNTPDDAAATWGCGNSGFSSSRTKRYGLNTGGAGQWGIVTVDDASTGANLVSSSSTSDSNNNVLEFTYSTSIGTILVNGTAQPAATAAAYAPGTLTPNRCAIGCRPDSAPDQFWDGNIAEILVFDREITAYERALVRIYLLRKWGIAEPTPLTIITSVSVTQWIRGDLGITLATGVSAWNDQSGNGHNFAQGTGSQQPAYNAADATLNNKPTVTGDGSNDTLVNNTISNGSGVWQSGIIKMNSWGNFKVVWGGPAVGDANDFLSQGVTPQLSMFSGVSVNFSTGLAVGQWGRAEVFWSGASSYLKLRSTTVSGGNPGSNSSTGCALFSSTGIGFGPYSIAERVMCSAKPTADEIATLDAYYTYSYGAGLV